MVIESKGQFTGRRISNFGDAKAGNHFVVFKNSNGHNYPVDKKLVFKRDGTPLMTSMGDAAEGATYNSLNATDVLLIEDDLSDLKQRLTHITDEYTKEKTDLEEKIKFCEDHDLDRYDHKLHSIVEVLEALKNEENNEEKAAKIIKILKSD